MSGGEPSSIKRSLQCAARVPVLSKKCDVRVEANFDLKVYGLVLQSGIIVLKKNFADRSRCAVRHFLF